MNSIWARQKEINDAAFKLLNFAISTHYAMGDADKGVRTGRNPHKNLREQISLLPTNTSDFATSQYGLKLFGLIASKFSFE